MKITKLEIKDFHQFKNFELDLTYPLGHEKEGEALDKVCIIGQSGTGKTTLIELLAGLTHNSNLLKQKYKLKKEDAIIFISNNDLKYTQVLSEDEAFSYTTGNWMKNNQESENTNDELLKLDTSYIEAVKPNLIYYPAELKYELNETNEIIDFKERAVVDFSIENASAIWNLILN